MQILLLGYLSILYHYIIHHYLSAQKQVKELINIFLQKNIEID